MDKTKPKVPVTPLKIPPDLREQLYASAERAGSTLTGRILFILKAAMARENSSK